MRYDHFSMLPEKAFQPRNGRQGMTLEGGGSGGGGGPQNVTQTTSNLPEYAKPYFTNLMQRAQAESYREYTPYRGQRIAGLTPAQLQTQRDVMAMERPGQFGVGSGMIGAGGMQSLQYGQGAINTGQQALGYGGMGADIGTMGAQAGQQYFDLATNPYATEAFMSPYMQNVVDVQKQAALRDAQMANLAGNLGSARQGTYGGARQLLAQTERERALAGKLGEIQASGSQRAYEDAQRALQFGTDVGLKGLGIGLEGARTGISGVQTGLQGYGMGLQGAQQTTQAGEALGQIGTAQQQADLQRFQAQAAVGEQQRAIEQQKLDTAYADFLRQRDYPMEQLGQYSAVLRGIPVQLGSTATTYAPPPSIASQIGGMGLAAAGAYNLFGGGK